MGCITLGRRFWRCLSQKIVGNPWAYYSSPTGGHMRLLSFGSFWVVNDQFHSIDFPYLLHHQVIQHPCWLQSFLPKQPPGCKGAPVEAGLHRKHVAFSWIVQNSSIKVGQGKKNKYKIKQIITRILPKHNTCSMSDVIGCPGLINTQWNKTSMINEHV